MADSTTSGDQSDQKSEQNKASGPDVASIEADLEETRERLAETVDALGAKLDVKTRASEKVTELREDAKVRTADAKVRATEVKAQATEKVTELREERGTELAAAAGTIVALLVVLVVWRRRR